MPYNMTDPLLSSPDPLTDTLTFPSPTKPVRRSRACKSQPIHGSSPTKQTFELDVGNELSPQKIRVTVEAENNKENSYAAITGQNSPPPPPPSYYVPAKLPKSRTTTTTVPLRGLSDTEDDGSADPPKRGRGRPRKSAGTPVPTKSKTRNITPSGKSPRRRRRTLGDLVDGDDEEDWDFEIGKSVEVGRGKGRSRSRSVKSASRKKPTTANSAGLSSDLRDSSVTTKRGRRQSLMPQEVPILEDPTENNAPNELPLEDESSNNEVPLKPLEQNTIDSRSEYSTIRSTTTAFGDSVTVAKFNLDRTPKATGWSSPRVVSIVPTRFSDRFSSGYKSSPLAHQMVDQTPQSNLTVNDVGANDAYSAHEEEIDHGDEVEDALGDFQEFDTILESEGFSMISVDSVPSLREHLSSPLTQSIPAEPDSSCEDQRAANQKSDTRFSDLSNSSPLAEASASKSRSYDKSQSIQQILTDVSVMSNSVKAQHKTTNGKRDQRHDADDSEILQTDSSVFDESKLRVPSVSAATTSTAETERPAAAGLPTPQDTPSPHNDFTELSAREDSREQVASATESDAVQPKTFTDSSIVMPQMRSSPPQLAPPRYTYTAHLRQRKSLGLTETPSIVFSSPSLPPPKQRPAAREHISDATESNGIPKPRLSSSVIAGRALQNIVVPNSSSTHSSYLRSPFKSPNSRRQTLSPTEEPTKEDEIQPSKLDSAVPGLGPISWRDLGRSRTLSEAASQPQNGRRARFMKNIPEIADDPFLAEASEQLRSPSPDEKQAYCLELPTPAQAINPQVAKLLTDDTNTVRHSDEMSWQAETCALRTPPRDDSEKLAAAASSRATVAQIEAQNQGYKDAWTEEGAISPTQRPGTDPTQVYVIPSDLPTIYSSSPTMQPQFTTIANFAEDAYDDNEDIWLAEARNSSSPLIEKSTKVISKQPIHEKPKRSKLPSPWRQNGRELMYSDELAAQASLDCSNRNESPATIQQDEAHIAEPPMPTGLAPNAVLPLKSSTEGGRMLRRSAQPQLTPKAVLLPKSTATVSELQHGVPQLGSLRKSIAFSKPPSNLFMAAERQPKMPPTTQSDEESDLSAAWNIPQKQNFQPRITPRQSNILGISALLTSSPVKRPEAAINSSPGTQENVNSTTTQRLPTSGIVHDTDQHVEKVEFTLEEETQLVSDEDKETTMNEFIKGVQGRGTAESPSALYDVSQLSQLSHSESFEESSRLSTTPTRQNPYRRPRSTSPLKSCIRTPSASSPTKAVVFSATTAASPPSTTPRFMEDSEWKKCHWLSLRTIYRDYKKYPTPPSEIPQSVKDSEYVDKMIYGKEPDGSMNMVMEEWMVDVVHLFLEEAEEQGMLWDEGFVCKRIYGLIIMEIIREEEKEEKEVAEREERCRKEAKEKARKLTEEEAQKKKGILGLGLGWL